VLLLREPSDAEIGRFLERQRVMLFSYPEVGASREGAPPGYGVNYHRGRLGYGQETYKRAIEALRRWKMYETGWTRLCWPDAAISEGTIVVVVGRHLGIRSLNACRIAYVYEDEVPTFKRFGFAVGTLPGHVERGEERFTVEWNRADDAVTYEVFAKLAQPLARRIQGHFAPDSLQSMAEAINSPQMKR
jgi:uncharacterized protein (UPF0548 family)